MEPIQNSQILIKPFSFDQTPYFLRFQQSPQLNLHPFLGYPMVPIIGRYGNAGYQLNQVLFVLDLPCIIENENCKSMGQKLNIPKKILNILKNIPELIPHNKPPKKVQKQKKQNEDEEVEGKDYHPLNFPTLNKFNLKFIITFDQSKRKNDFLNYVNHTYIFKQFDFSIKKKLIHYLPLCLVPPEQQKDCGIYQWERDYKSISFNKLRSEYISFHLKKGAPAFSPNNLKFGIKQKIEFAHFFTVILTEQKYTVNYHWHIFNKQLQKWIEGTLKNSFSLIQFIQNYKKKRVDILIKTFENLFI